MIFIFFVESNRESLPPPEERASQTFDRAMHINVQPDETFVDVVVSEVPQLKRVLIGEVQVSGQMNEYDKVATVEVGTSEYGQQMLPYFAKHRMCIGPAVAFCLKVKVAKAKKKKK